MPAGSLIVREEHLALLKALLLRHVPEAEVWAYGSRVTGGGHEASDLDLVRRDPRDLSRPQKNYWELKEAITDSNTPFLVDVMDWARIPESFREQISKSYVVIQSQDRDG
ncbi:MAG: nucleotidyltransferase domain-containing protein [Nitrospinae bacterium]|nr:nucleotidyltransferase domain-containing protein [Nitrospinota bacterium]